MVAALGVKPSGSGRSIAPGRRPRQAANPAAHLAEHQSDWASHNSSDALPSSPIPDRKCTNCDIVHGPSQQPFSNRRFVRTLGIVFFSRRAAAPSTAAVLQSSLSLLVIVFTRYLCTWRNNRRHNSGNCRNGDYLYVMETHRSVSAVELRHRAGLWTIGEVAVVVGLPARRAAPTPADPTSDRRMPWTARTLTGYIG